MSSVARKCVIIVAMARDQLAFQETKFFQKKGKGGEVKHRNREIVAYV